MGLDSVGETCSGMWQGKPRLTVASNQTKLAISTIFNVAMSVEKWLLTCYTAQKTIFSFSRRSEKMVFPKKLRWNMIFLVLSGKMIFLFPENMILHLRRKMKDDLSQKNTRKYDIFFKLSQKMVFRTWFFMYYLERWYFFPEKMIYFPWAESERQSFSWNIWKYDIFFVHGCYKRGATPLCRKN